MLIREGDEVLMTHWGSFDAFDWTKQRGMRACCIIESQYLANGEKEENKYVLLKSAALQTSCDTWMPKTSCKCDFKNIDKKNKTKLFSVWLRYWFLKCAQTFLCFLWYNSIEEIFYPVNQGWDVGISEVLVIRCTDYLRPTFSKFKERVETVWTLKSEPQIWKTT